MTAFKSRRRLRKKVDYSEGKEKGWKWRSNWRKVEYRPIDSKRNVKEEEPNKENGHQKFPVARLYMVKRIRYLRCNPMIITYYTYCRTIVMTNPARDATQTGPSSVWIEVKLLFHIWRNANASTTHLESTSNTNNAWMSEIDFNRPTMPHVSEITMKYDSTYDARATALMGGRRR